MKYIVVSLFIIALISIRAQETDSQYDSVLASELGADEYGMKSYFLVMLSSGDSIIKDQNRVRKLFSGHLNNIQRLEKERKLIVAGPIEENSAGYRGIFIFDINNKKELVEALDSDPAIRARLLNYEIYKWYGSAALPKYLDTHRKIQKTDF